MKPSYPCRLLHGDSRNDWAYDFDNSNRHKSERVCERYLKHPESQPMTTYESQEIGIGRYTGSYIFGKIHKTISFPQLNGSIVKNETSSQSKTQPPVNPKFNKNVDCKFNSQQTDADSVYEIYDDTYEEPYALTLKIRLHLQYHTLLAFISLYKLYPGSHRP